MRVRLLKHFNQSFSEQNYMVFREGNLPIVPFIGLQIDVRDTNEVLNPEFVVKRVIVSFNEEELIYIIVEPLNSEEQDFELKEELAAVARPYIDAGWEMHEGPAKFIGLL